MPGALAQVFASLCSSCGADPSILGACRTSRGLRARASSRLPRSPPWKRCVSASPAAPAAAARLTLLSRATVHQAPITSMTATMLQRQNINLQSSMSQSRTKLQTLEIQVRTVKHSHAVGRGGASHPPGSAAL